MIDPIRVVLAGIRDGRARAKSESFGMTPEESMGELRQLSLTLGYVPCGEIVQERDAPDPATYLGKGKVSELAGLVSSLEASLVIFDGALSPVQVWNVQDATGVATIDRTELILRIFAARALTKEGKLQVELAATRHALTRLTGHGRDMSGLGGGIGTRGPGEQRLEMDRRLARNRISKLNRELKEVERVRAEQRKRRKQSGMPLVSLVGYTNAGKSTLFSALTGQETLCDDRLFATLDPWVRKWEMSSGQVVLLCDTVGFIQGLPHELVAAFRATLEESVDADALIHLVDSASPVWEQQIATVEGVLSDLEVDDLPRLTCFNKTDLLPEGKVTSVARSYEPSLAISALQETGLLDLERAVTDLLAESGRQVMWDIPYAQWDIIYEIRRLGVILEEKHHKDGATITCVMGSRDAQRLARKLRLLANAQGNADDAEPTR